MTDAGGPDDMIAQQRYYYDERAPDFLDPAKPSDRKIRGDPTEGFIRALIDGFAPTGDVLEFACGGGSCTRHLVRHASSVTALDGSPRMLERNRETVGSPKVDYVLADVFDWQPDRTYDAVVFTFWLSHVPPSHFDGFWALVRRCLKPSGRVCFVDEDDRASGNDDVTVVDGIPLAKRTLGDGRVFDIVKVFWRPDDLEQRLRTGGWDIDVRPVGDSFLFGSGAPSIG